MRTLALLLALCGVAWAQVPPCGNGVTEPPELCDDGNLISGDGCDANCTPTGCGNGILTAGEECDDGNNVSGDCCSATCVSENLPPDCTAAEASLGNLWPPNHKFVPVRVAGVTDPDGDPLVIAVTAIAQDEPLDATGDGATCPDGVGVGIDTASLRSERSGHGDGRVYHVAFQAVDRCNAVCVGAVEVCVRHDQRPNGTCGDGGPLFDSTAGAPPCDGDSCDLEDCVPDPEDIDACEDEDVPPSVEVRVGRARSLIERGGKVGPAARQLRKAAKRAVRAGRNGGVSGECAAALSGALEAGRDCVVCSAG